MKIRLLGVVKKDKERGYTMLEYAAGAALIAVVLGAVITTIGGGFRNLASGVSSWATREANDLAADNPTP